MARAGKGRQNGVPGRPYTHAFKKKVVDCAVKSRSCNYAAVRFKVSALTVRKWVRESGVDLREWIGKPKGFIKQGESQNE
jgi:transposase-like protein